MEYYVLSWVAYVIASAVFLIIVFSCFSAIFNRKYNFAVIYGVGIVLAAVNLLFLLANNPIINMVVLILTLTVIAMLFSGSFRNRLIFTVFLLTSAVVSEFIVAYAIALWGDASPDYMQFGTPEFAIGLMLSRTQFAIFARIISKIAEKRELPTISIKRWIILIAPPIGSLLVLYNFMFQRTHNILDIISSIVVMITSIVVLTVYGKILSDYEVEVKNRYLEELLSHFRYQYSMAEKSEKLISKTKHDIKNLLIGFQAEIKSQNVESVQKGITDLLGEIDSYDGPAKSGNLVIDSIINYKAGIARESNIYFSMDLDIPENLEFDSVVICQIIGNALDNAVEATEKIQDVKKRIIEIAIKIEHGALLIQITNPYVDNIVINTKGSIMSAKRNYRTEGIGLQSIAGIVSENEGTFNINYGGNKFCLSVMLYKGS